MNDIEQENSIDEEEGDSPSTSLMTDSVSDPEDDQVGNGES